LKLNSSQSSSSGFKKILKNVTRNSDLRSQRLPSPVGLVTEPKVAVNMFSTQKSAKAYHMHTEPISPRFERA